MRSDLVRNDTDSRTRECGEGTPPCPRAWADEPNPLHLCEEHLSAHRARCGIPEPAICPACDPICVLVPALGRFIPIAGAMCFACGAATGGTVATHVHRMEARAAMIARIGGMLAAGDRGPEWVATLARCPADVRERAEARASIPAET